jgi:hypothetical protein
MWSLFAGMILTGHCTILGVGWAVGPANKFVVEHQLNCVKEQVVPPGSSSLDIVSSSSSSSTAVVQNNDKWSTLTNPTQQLLGNFYLKLWYAAGQAMMVS